MGHRRSWRSQWHAGQRRVRGGGCPRALDEIRIGDAIFKFVESEVEGYARYRIDGALVGEKAEKLSDARPASGQVVGGYQSQRLAAEVSDIAKSELSVLILGETGTGKEVLARQLHKQSGRSGPFQAINCAAIPVALIEGELFGHRRGAFSGADRDRPGLIRAASGGTLFLDEIGDMPLEAQAKLLRVLQSKEVLPVGASQPERVDVRVVSATHRDVRKLQETGAFRGDLFARLNEYSVRLPPLRDRKEDIYALCLALAAAHGRLEVDVTFAFMSAVLHYDFPFNIRELEAIIKRWVTIARGPVLNVEHLPDEIKEHLKTYMVRRPAAPQPMAPPPAAQQPVTPRASDPPPEPAERIPSEQALRELLVRHSGNVAAVARHLNKDRTQIHRWVRRYGINLDEYR